MKEKKKYIEFSCLNDFIAIVILKGKPFNEHYNQFMNYDK